MNQGSSALRSLEPGNMFLGRPENDYSECVPPRAVASPNQENYYSTLRRGKEILNITALAMSTSSVYENKPGSGELSFEPMYIDVVSNGPATKKSSRKTKCLFAWLVMLTIISLTSLAFTTLILYKAGWANGSAIFFSDSSSDTNGKKNII